MCENIALNRAKNVVPFCVTLVSEDRRLATLSFRGSHSGGASLKKRLNRRVPVLCVNHEMLDQLGDEMQGGFLMKIDVEGSENEVLAAIARSRIADRVRHSGWVNSITLRGALSSPGMSSGSTRL